MKGANVVTNFESAEIAEAKVKEAQEAFIATPQEPKVFKPLGKSGFLGVRESGKYWEAIVHYNAKGHRLGVFNTKEVCG